MAFCFVILWISFVYAAMLNDEIKSLPGYQSQLPSKQYSGFLEIPNSQPKRYYHYWFVESQSIAHKDPYSDPFIVWFNGGPGASSLEGLFTEMGVLHLNDYSLIYNTTEYPQLWYNEYSWNTFANMLYIESPAGVGFSYCEDSICPSWNDSSVASDNYQILKQFFIHYPEYVNNSQFYLTGESYAGIYIPTLVMEIERNQNIGVPELKGIAIGNGCIGIDGQGGCDNDQIALDINFMHGHGQISNKLYQRALDICGSSIYYGNWTKLPRCEAMILEGLEKIGGYYVYNLYDPCWEKNYSKPYMAEMNNDLAMDESVDYNSEYACGNRVYIQYLNLNAVKKAINMPQRLVWRQRAELDYNQTQKDLRPWFKEQIEKGEYRILIYNGDVDTAVPTLAANEWTYGLGFDVYENEEWRPWATDGAMDMAGYVTIWNTSMNFTLATIRGAGHMAAQYRPKQSLALIRSFIDSEFPRYQTTDE